MTFTLDPGTIVTIISFGILALLAFVRSERLASDANIKNLANIVQDSNEKTRDNFKDLFEKQGDMREAQAFINGKIEARVDAMERVNVSS